MSDTINKKKSKAYVYTRVSTEMQVDGYSLDAQKDKAEAYAKLHDITIVREYRDEGKSGKSTEGRDEFNRMIADIVDRKDDVKYVIVFKLSRFGRNTRDVLETLETIQDYGVELVSVSEGIDSSLGSGKLMITMLAAVAEIERENILSQAMAARERLCRDGGWNGGFPAYGYYLENHSLCIAEDEAEAIRIIFDKFVHTDLGYNGVANYLNRNGIKKKARQNGKLTDFTSSFVKGVLDNPIYCGRIAYGRRKTEKIEGKKGKTHIVKQKEYTSYPGKHEAIVSEELWRDAQEKRKQTARRQEKKHDIEHEHILSRIIKCPVCGDGMYGDISRKKKKDGTYYPTYFTYRCKHRRSIADGHECTCNHRWNASKIENAVAEIIIDIVNKPEFSDIMKKKIDSKIDTSEVDKEKENAQKELRRVKATKNLLLSQIDSLDPEDKSYNARYEDYQKRIDTAYSTITDLEEYIAECDRRIENIKRDKISSESIYNYLMLFEKLYKSFSDKEKKMFYNALLSDIFVYPEELENGQLIKSIKFKFPIYYDGSFTDEVFRDKNSHVESVVLITRKEK